MSEIPEATGAVIAAIGGIVMIFCVTFFICTLMLTSGMKSTHKIDGYDLRAATADLKEAVQYKACLDNGYKWQFGGCEYE